MRVQWMCEHEQRSKYYFVFVNWVLRVGGGSDGGSPQSPPVGRNEGCGFPVLPVSSDSAAVSFPLSSPPVSSNES